MVSHRSSVMVPAGLSAFRMWSASIISWVWFFLWIKLSIIPILGYNLYSVRLAKVASPTEIKNSEDLISSIASSKSGYNLPKGFLRSIIISLFNSASNVTRKHLYLTLKQYSPGTSIFNSRAILDSSGSVIIKRPLQLSEVGFPQLGQWSLLEIILQTVQAFIF